MNIVKLQNQLKSIPVETLIKYVQGMNPEVPSYLALAEIKNRKDMESKYASQNQQTPEKSVAEDLTQAPDQSGLAMLAGNPMGNPAQPDQAPQGAPTMPADQGVASLDTGDMFNEQNFASGGIVAFDEGGDVGMNLDNLPALNLNTGMQGGGGGISDILYSQGYGPFSAIFPDIMKQMSQSDRAKFLESGMGAFFGMREAPKQDYYSSNGNMVSMYGGSGPQQRTGDGKLVSSGYADGGMVAFDNGGPVATSKFGDFFRGLGNRGALDIDKQIGALQAEKNKISYDIFSAYTPEQRATQQQRLADIDAQIATLTEQRSSAANMPRVEKPALAAPGLAGLNTPSTVDNKLTNEDIGNIYRSTTPTPTKARPTVLPTAANTDVTKPAAGPAPTPKEAGIESLLEDTDGLAEKKMARYKQMVGEDPERARLEELTRKYETGAAEQERMAPWMALAKAGFSMAGGKSPFAIQNLAEGAQAGLADYVQAKDKLDKLTEKQIDIRSKMQQARRAEDIAGATYGLNSEAAIEARNAQVKLKDMEEKNAFARTKYAADVSTKNAMIAAAKKSDYETFMDLAKQDKDGTVRKVFDASKVTQTWKSFSGSSGLDDDKLFAAYQQEKMMDKNFNKSFQEYKNEIRGQSGAPAASSASSGFYNFRQSSK